MSTPTVKPVKQASKFFTAEEDMQIWKHMLFGDHKQNKSGRNLNEWPQFIKTTGSKRCTSSLDARFRDKLCPHLPLTLFHTETKLNFCIEYKIKVEDKFLKVLEEDAQVDFDKDSSYIVGYTMKPTAKPNLDHLLSDTLLLEFSSPIGINKEKFTEEEDEMIWEYAIENRRKYTPKSVAFWEGLNRKFNGVRSKSALSYRFMYFLAPNLQKKKFGTKIKLKLSKTYKIFLDPEYMKKLKRRYDVRVDEEGCVRNYKEKPKVAEGGVDVADETLPVEDDPLIEYVADRKRDIQIGAANMKQIEVENRSKLKMEDDSDESDEEMHQDDTLQSSETLENAGKRRKGESGSTESEFEESSSEKSDDEPESQYSGLDSPEDSMELDDHVGDTSRSSSRSEPPESGEQSDDPVFKSAYDSDEEPIVDGKDSPQSSAILESGTDKQEREELGSNESGSGERTESGLSGSPALEDSMELDDHVSERTRSSSSRFEPPESGEESDDPVYKSAYDSDEEPIVDGKDSPQSSAIPLKVRRDEHVSETSGSSSSRCEPPESAEQSDEEDEDAPEPRVPFSEIIQSKPPMKKPKMEYESDDDTDEEPIVDDADNSPNSAILDSDTGEQEREEPESNESESGEVLSESGEEPESENSGSSGSEDPESIESENPVKQDAKVAKSSSQEDQSGQHKVATARPTQILKTPTVAETPRSSGSRSDQMEAETAPKPTIASSELIQTKTKPKVEYESDDDSDENPLVDDKDSPQSPATLESDTDEREREELVSNESESGEGLSESGEEPESGSSGSSGSEDPESMESENPMEQDYQAVKASSAVLKMEDDSDESDDEMHQEDVLQSPETPLNARKRRREVSGGENIMELDNQVAETTRSSSRRSDQQTVKAVRPIRETPAANPDSTLNDDRNTAIEEEPDDELRSNESESGEGLSESGEEPELENSASSGLEDPGSRESESRMEQDNQAGEHTVAIPRSTQILNTHRGVPEQEIQDELEELDEDPSVQDDMENDAVQKSEPAEPGEQSDEEDEDAPEPRIASSEMLQSKPPMKKPKMDYESDDDADDDDPLVEPESERSGSYGPEDPESMESENPMEQGDLVDNSSRREDQSGQHTATPRPSQISEAPAVVETSRSSGIQSYELREYRQSAMMFDQQLGVTALNDTTDDVNLENEISRVSSPEGPESLDQNRDPKNRQDTEDIAEPAAKRARIESDSSSDSREVDDQVVENRSELKMEDDSDESDEEMHQDNALQSPETLQNARKRRREVSGGKNTMELDNQVAETTRSSSRRSDQQRTKAENPMELDDQVDNSSRQQVQTDQHTDATPRPTQIFKPSAVGETSRSSGSRSDQQTVKAVRPIRETPAADQDSTSNDTRSIAIEEELEDDLENGSVQKNVNDPPESEELSDEEDEEAPELKVEDESDEVASQRLETPENRTGSSGASGGSEEPESMEVGSRNSEDPTNSSVMEMVRRASSTESTEVDYRSQRPEADMEVVRQGKLEMCSNSEQDGQSGNEDEALDVKPKVAPEPRRVSPREAIDRALNDPIDNVKMESETDRFPSSRNRNTKNPHDTKDIAEPAVKRARIRSDSESEDVEKQDPHRRSNKILKLEVDPENHNDQELEPVNLQEIQNTDDVSAAKIEKSIQNEIRDIRQRIPPASVENEARPTAKKKEFLQNLKNFLSTIPSPDIEDVIRKLVADIQNSPDDDLDLIQMKLIASSGETMRLAVSRQE